jgi:hypothetical protein
MRYIFVGEGGKEDIGKTEHYTELGWELMVTRLAFIRDLNLGIWNKDDTVVTLSDRKFLYSKLCNVVSTSDFNSEPNDTVFHYSDGADFIDYVKMVKTLEDLHGKYMKGLTNNYQHISDKPQILDIDYEDVETKYNIKDSFVGMLVRTRGWCPERNTNENEAKEMLNKLLTMYKKVFIFGLGSKHLADGERIIYLDTLREWASVMHSKFCDFIIGVGSGGSMICQLCCNSALLLIPNGGPICQRHPLFYSSSVTFSNLKILLGTSSSQILNYVEENCKNHNKPQ